MRNPFVRLAGAIKRGWVKLQMAHPAAAQKLEALGMVIGVPSSWFTFGFPPKADWLRFEDLYKDTPMLVYAIQQLAEQAIGPGFYLKVKSTDPDVTADAEKAVDICNEFNERVNAKMVQLRIAVELGMYGNSCLERRFTEVVKDDADPYHATSIGEFVTIQALPMSTMRVVPAMYTGVQPPRGYVQIIQGNYQKFAPEQIAWFRVNINGGQLGSDFYGMGMIQPVLNYVWALRKIEKNLLQISDRYAAPKYHWQLGDKDFPPSPEQITNWAAGLDQIEVNEDWVTAYTTNVHAIAPDVRMRFDEVIQHFRQMIVAGLQNPNLMLVISQARVSDASAQAMQAAWNLKVAIMQETVKELWEDYIYKPLLAQNGIDTELCPEHVWGEPDSVDPKDQIDNLLKALNPGQVVVDAKTQFELVNMLRQAFGMEALESTQQPTPAAAVQPSPNSSNAPNAQPTPGASNTPGAADTGATSGAPDAEQAKLVKAVEDVLAKERKSKERVKLREMAQTPPITYVWNTHPGDTKTGPCEKCEEFDGQEFTADEAMIQRVGEDMHPNCACTIEPVMLEEKLEEKGWSAAARAAAAATRANRAHAQANVAGVPAAPPTGGAKPGAKAHAPKAPKAAKPHAVKAPKHAKAKKPKHTKVKDPWAHAKKGKKGPKQKVVKPLKAPKAVKQPKAAKPHVAKPPKAPKPKKSKHQIAYDAYEYTLIETRGLKPEQAQGLWGKLSESQQDNILAQVQGMVSSERSRNAGLSEDAAWEVIAERIAEAIKKKLHPMKPVTGPPEAADAGSPALKHYPPSETQGQNVHPPNWVATVKMMESFRWTSPFKIVKEKDDVFIKGDAITHGKTLNKSNYTADELLRSARTLAGKPMLHNHLETVDEAKAYLQAKASLMPDLVRKNIEDMIETGNVHIGHVVLSEYEDGAVEYIGKIETETAKAMAEAGLIKGPSIGAVPWNGDLDNPRGIIFEDLSLITAPETPGDPDATSKTMEKLYEMVHTEQPVVTIHEQLREALQERLDRALKVREDRVRWPEFS